MQVLASTQHERAGLGSLGQRLAGACRCMLRGPIPEAALVQVHRQADHLLRSVGLQPGMATERIEAIDVVDADVQRFCEGRLAGQSADAASWLVSV
ncbi:hypothetical protein HK414_01595 [Ramlibacter terrae]|uniref:Uncharacterized protein n=1 Tax=Ramlibacter terrae TaxID=2732511 RepID=A0ABX6NZZ8_9BURK|nr:hypothetical protein HK414_01595 [Ramlibacter terrae]